MARGHVGDIAEVGYVFQERESGASKVTWKQYLEYVGHLVRLRINSHTHKAYLRKNFPIRRFIRYGIVGLSGVFLDMLVLYLLHGTELGFGLTTSKLIAAETAILSNFIWNDSWTFADMVGSQTGSASQFKRLLKFNAICLIGLFLDVVLLNIFFNLVFSQSRAYLANFIAISLVAIWNFWLNLKLNWRTSATSK